MLTVGQCISLLKTDSPYLHVVVQDNCGNNYFVNNVWIDDRGRRVYIVSVEDDNNFCNDGALFNQLESYKERLEVRFIAYAKDGSRVITELELDNFGNRVYFNDIDQDVFMIYSK